MFLFYYNKFLK